jgi:DeoR family glycerol-3-phosphate regulon repressor
MITDSASLFINIGTIIWTIARALLNHKGLRVVTKNLNAAAILGAKEDFSVVIVSAEVRHRNASVIVETTKK